MYRFRRLDQIFISLVARLTQLLEAKRPISGCHPVDFFSLRIKEDICLFFRKKRLRKMEKTANRNAWHATYLLMVTALAPQSPQVA